MSAATVTVNKDIARERTRASFDVEKVTEFIYNGKSAVRKRRYLQNIVFQDKYLQSFKPWCNTERKEMYDSAVKRGVYANQLIEKLNITSLQEQAYIMGAALPNETNPLGIHRAMFMPTIEKLGTQEQKEYWLPLAKSYKILGTYAQTELGHGTFLRGLETTATYDPTTEEFVVNSPTLTSMKYWPGGLGKTSTHVVLMAQLYTQGKCHGMHSFVVQLRSLKDHKPLPGIRVGDIGNKYGFNAVDNGFLMFDNYRIPRDAMLMRYTQVAKDGKYSRVGNPTIAYGTMIFIRAMIVGSTGIGLSMATTIATRYSAVRRQTEARPGGEELQIIDYQTQQEKLFPFLAAAYAFILVGNDVMKSYVRISESIDKGQMDELPVIHALCAGLKAVTSYTANSGIDSLRMACGGHGYTHASGLPKIFAQFTPACTYEGENTVMLLQTARYLMKCAAKAAAGETLPGFMTYLSRQGSKSSPLTASLELPQLIDAYEHRAARMIIAAAKKIQRLMELGKSQEDARNMTSVELVRASTAHCQAFIVKTFAGIVSQPDLDPGVAKVMVCLCRLYAVHGMTEKIGDFIIDGYVSSAQAEMLMRKLLDLFAEIRPEAVALVDAFDYDDKILGSCIGRYDGNVYEALYEYAKDSPLNESDVMDVHHTTVKPLMEGKLMSLGPSARL